MPTTAPDLHLARNLLVYTVLCNPEDNEFFFKIWKGTNEVFALIEQGDPLSHAAPGFSNFNIKELVNFEQRILREKNTDASPQLIVQSEYLVQKSLTNLETANNLDVLLIDGRHFTKELFFIDSSTNLTAKPFDEQVIIADSHLNTFFNDWPQFNAESVVDDDHQWRCKPSLQKIIQFNFLESLDRLPEKDKVDDCSLKLIFYGEKLASLKPSTLATYDQIKFEETVWDLILGVRKNREFTELEISHENLSPHSRSKIKQFLSNELISFARDKAKATDRIARYYLSIFSEKDHEYYGLLLQQYCSSASRQRIENAQLLIDSLHQKMDTQTFVSGRLLFLRDRYRHFDNVGWVGGSLGIIGSKSTNDYCVNLGTLAQRIIETQAPHREKIASLISYLKLDRESVTIKEWKQKIYPLKCKNILQMLEFNGNFL